MLEDLLLRIPHGALPIGQIMVKSQQVQDPVHDQQVELVRDFASMAPCLILRVRNAKGEVAQVGFAFQEFTGRERKDIRRLIQAGVGQVEQPAFSQSP